MDFPSYVPNAVRVSLAARLEGDRIEPSGWISALTSAEDNLLRIQRLQDKWRHDEAMSTNLRIEHAEATEHCDQLAAEVACCQRLVHDARMQPAYVRLVSLPTVTDAYLSGFIHAAWAAMIDYSQYRDRITDAADLAGKVADVAGVLAGLLERAESSGWHGHFPPEFFGLRSLMERTEHAPCDRDFRMWPGMRTYILGESEPAQVEPREPGEPPELVRIEFVPLTKAETLDPDEERRNMLHYAWNTAPSVSRIIATLHRAALACEPAESGFIGAAIASRKRNREREYLRAFAALLRDEHKIELTADTIHAMATTATVVLNEPNLVVTYDDVKKAVATIAS